jgi:hypothetical protein
MSPFGAVGGHAFREGSYGQVFAAVVFFTLALTAGIIFGAVFFRNWAFLWALPIVLGIGVPASIVLFILWRKGEDF